MAAVGSSGDDDRKDVWVCCAQGVIAVAEAVGVAKSGVELGVVVLDDVDEDGDGVNDALWGGATEDEDGAASFWTSTNLIWHLTNALLNVYRMTQLVSRGQHTSVAPPERYRYSEPHSSPRYKLMLGQHSSGLKFTTGRNHRQDSLEAGVLLPSQDGLDIFFPTQHQPMLRNCWQVGNAWFDRVPVTDGLAGMIINIWL